MRYLLKENLSLMIENRAPEGKIYPLMIVVWLFIFAA